MVQEITDKAWLAEARTEETKRFIRDVRRVTRRRFSAEENEARSPWTTLSPCVDREERSLP